MLSNNIKIKILVCRTTVLLVLCACETASYTERKKKKKQAETAREFGTEEDTWSLRGRSDGVWRKLLNEELRDVYCSLDIYSCALIQECVMGWACSP